jgi:hypothetical protein
MLAVVSGLEMLQRMIGDGQNLNVLSVDDRSAALP